MFYLAAVAHKCDEKEFRKSSEKFLRVSHLLGNFWIVSLQRYVIKMVPWQVLSGEFLCYFSEQLFYSTSNNAYSWPWYWCLIVFNWRKVSTKIDGNQNKPVYQNDDLRRQKKGTSFEMSILIQISCSIYFMLYQDKLQVTCT